MKTPLLLKYSFLIPRGDLKVHLFIKMVSSLKLFFEEWNLLIAIVDDQFLFADIPQSADILCQFAFKRKRESQDQTGYTANIDTFAKKLASG